MVVRFRLSLNINTNDAFIKGMPWHILKIITILAEGCQKFKVNNIQGFTCEQVFYLLQIEANPVNMRLLCFYSAVKANSKLDHKFAKKILSLAWL